MAGDPPLVDAPPDRPLVPGRARRPPGRRAGERRRAPRAAGRGTGDDTAAGARPDAGRPAAPVARRRRPSRPAPAGRRSRPRRRPHRRRPRSSSRSRPATAPVIPDATGRYIVMLRSGSDTAAAVSRARLRAHVKADQTYTRSVRGFAAKLDAPSAATLLADPSVSAIVPDGVVQLTAQTVPTGVSRVGGRQNDIAAIDGIDHRVDADVAIVDTGIAYHPDLNVAGGYNCSTTDPTGVARQEQPRDARRRHGRRARQRHRRRRRRPGRPGVGRQDPQRRRLRPDLVVHLRPRLDPRPARPDRRQPAALRGRQHERHEARLATTATAAHQQRPAPPGDLPRRRRRDHRRRRGRQRPPQRGQQHPGQLRRGHHRLGPRRHRWQGRRPRRQPRATRGAATTRTTRSPTSATTARDVDIIAPGKCILSTIPGGYGTPTCRGRPWRPRPSPAPWRSTRRAGRTRRRPRSARRCATSATSTGRSRPTPTRPTSRCSTCRGSRPLGTFDLAPPPRPARRPRPARQRPIPFTLVRSATFFERVQLSITSLPDGWTGGRHRPA